MKKVTKIIATTILGLSLTTTAIPVMAHDDGFVRNVAMILETKIVDMADVATELGKKETLVAIELDKQEGIFSSGPEKIVYEALTLKGDVLTKSYIDITTGKTIDSKKVSSWNPFDDDVKEAQAIAGAKVSLENAIKLAEEKFVGKAIKAELEDENSVIFYEILVHTDNGIIAGQVSPETGKVVKMARRFHDDDDRDDDH